MPTTRRQLILASSAASYSRVLGANDRIRMGVVGTGPRGQYLMRELARTGTVEFVALCDVYTARRDQAATIAGGAVKTYGEHERVLEHKDIDAVVIATPDHWHAPIAVDACRAGKDIYIEKPMVHTPEAGQAIVKAARAGKRIVQVGMQGRAVPHFLEARAKAIESGHMGKVGLARTWYNSNAGYVQQAPPGMESKPEGLNWERWLGPGPKALWNPGIYFSPYKWLHYDGGMIMGIGIHVIDTAHHMLGLSKPLSAVAAGGIYHHRDGRDTPDVVNLILEYPQGVNVTFEAECLTAEVSKPGVKWGSSAGVELRGTGGILTIHRYDNLGWEYRPTPSSGHAAAGGKGGPANAEGLVKNWLECIRTRARTVANEEEGYWSAVACYMGNEAYRRKTRVTWERRWELPA